MSTTGMIGTGISRGTPVEHSYALRVSGQNALRVSSQTELFGLGARGETLAAPEPASMALFGLGAFGLCTIGLQRKWKLTS